MAEKPAKKSSPVRAAKTVVKKPLKSTPKTVVKRAPVKRVPKAKSADEVRQEVAQRIVRKIFEEAGVTESMTIADMAARRSATRAAAEAQSEPAKEVPQPTTPTEDESLVLPTSINERLLSKKHALQEWYEAHFPNHVSTYARVLGMGFVLFGGAILAQYTTVQFSNWGVFQTAVVCQTLPCEESTASGAGATTTVKSTDGTAAIPSPAVSFLTKIASPLTEKATFIVRAEYVSDIAVLAESRATGLFTPLVSAGAPSGADYSFTVSPQQFKPGEYDIRVRVTAARDGKRVLVSGPRFKVLEAETPETDTTRDATEADDESTPPSTATTTSTPQPVSTTQNSVTLAYTPTDLPGVIRVAVMATDATTVEVFAQRTNATTPYFIAQAKRLEGSYWQHTLDTNTLPAGTYKLFAKAKTRAGLLTSNTRDLSIAARIAVSNSTSTPDSRATIETKEAVTEMASDSTPPPIRTEYVAPAPVSTPRVVSTEPTPSSTSSTAPASSTRLSVAPKPIETRSAIEPAIQERLDGEEQSLNDLLMRYASAFQARDESAQILIKDELSKKRAAIVEESVREGDTTSAASELDEALEQEFARLTKRVETFEILLRDRSGQSSSVDADNDGLSDYDEVTLYGTDPNLFDSDGDGIPDGAEIMRGFDPLSAKGETVLTFTSPKEVGIIRDDVLSVSAITPIIETDDTRGTPRVQAEITGRALPNSIVTLLIYSTPTVVTVRTDTDGTFTYQFDKELEDGSHEIYVAVTDNTGDVIAKSSPFRFVKEAEAFTVTDEGAVAEAPVVSSITPLPTRDLYNIVAALGVLSLGLILIIFGVTMRREVPAKGTEKAEAVAL